jgi:hypothetical protein
LYAGAIGFNLIRMKYLWKIKISAFKFL